MPFGFGLHPWFERDRDVELMFAASHFFMEGPEGIATERLATPSRTRLFATAARCRAAGATMTMAAGPASREVRFPSASASDFVSRPLPVFEHLMLYADPARPFFCLEPQSNAPCAFNRLGAGRRAGWARSCSRPGEALEATIMLHAVRDSEALEQPRRQAAIDQQGAAGDEGGGVRQQEADRRGDLARRGDAGDRVGLEGQAERLRRRRLPRARPASSGWRPSRPARALTRMRSTA